MACAVRPERKVQDVVVAVPYFQSSEERAVDSSSRYFDAPAGTSTSDQALSISPIFTPSR